MKFTTCQNIDGGGTASARNVTVSPLEMDLDIQLGRPLLFKDFLGQASLIHKFSATEHTTTVLLGMDQQGEALGGSSCSQADPKRAAAANFAHGQSFAALDRWHNTKGSSIDLGAMPRLGVKH
jgi:hypothetical protein